MYLTDRLTIDTTRRTSDGYLTVSARAARAGNVQTYLGSEVGKPHLATVRVYRPEAEVFNRESMSSFAHKPVTFGHPSQAVTSGNWKDVAKGWSDGEIVRDGEFVRVNMLLADANAIQAVEAGTRQLSMGYDCSLVWEDGTTPAGERYDARQVGIRGNHIAIVEAARGGSGLRIGDSAPTLRKEQTMMTDAEQATMRASVRGMPLADAAKLPIYDNLRGLWNSDMPAENLAALYDGAVVGERAISDEEHRAQARRDHFVEGLAKGGTALNDNRPAPVFARDGRPLSQMPPHERAHEEMILQQTSTWKS